MRQARQIVVAAAIVAGLLFVSGSVCAYDAFEDRGWVTGAPRSGLPPRVTWYLSRYFGGHIDVGTHAVPHAVDWDNDGDWDLLTGQYEGGGLKLWRNYQEEADEDPYPYPEDESWFRDYTVLRGGSDAIAVNYSGVMGAFPTVVDWDADGRKDLLIGDAEGYVWVALNVGTDEEPEFTAPERLRLVLPILFEEGPITEFEYVAYIDVGKNAMPIVWDWDGDGDEDLLVGSHEGYVYLFINEGTNASRRFSLYDEYDREMSGDANGHRIGWGDTNERFGSNCQVQVVDWDRDGIEDFIIGAYVEGDYGGAFEVMFYKNTPTLNPLIGSDDPFFYGAYGYLDVLWGYSSGMTVTATIAHWVSNVLSTYYGETMPELVRFHLVDWDKDGRRDILVGDPAGYVWIFHGLETPLAEPFFKAEPTTGFEPLVVSFEDQSTGNPTQWQWDFGDGSYSNEQNPEHVFFVSGRGPYTEYDVSLDLNSAAGPYSRKIKVYTQPTSGMVGLDEDFEDPDVCTHGWERTPDTRYNLWKLVNTDWTAYSLAHNGARSLYYGIEIETEGGACTKGTYATGSTNDGELVSPPVSLGTDSYVLTFWRWEEVETRRQSSAGPSLQPATGVYRALMVGINEYDPWYIPPQGWLRACVNDALGVRDELLEDSSRWSSSGITTLTDAQATESGITSTISSAASALGFGDVFVYFHSSHGGQDPQAGPTDTYVCTYSSEFTDVELGNALAAFSTDVAVIVIVDACHSGGLFQVDWPFAENVMASYVAAKAQSLAAQGQPIPPSLGQNIGFITACNYDEYSYEGAEYGVFTSYLIEAFNTPEADSNLDWDLTFWELYEYAAPRASAEIALQTAQYYNQPLLSDTIAVSEEPPIIFDSRQIYLSADSGLTWMPRPIYSSDGNNPREWVLETVSLENFAQETVRFKFVFDTLDAKDNQYRGWYVDDVQIVGVGTLERVLMDGFEEALCFELPELTVGQASFTVLFAKGRLPLNASTASQYLPISQLGTLRPGTEISLGVVPTASAPYAFYFLGNMSAALPLEDLTPGNEPYRSVLYTAGPIGGVVDTVRVEDNLGDFIDVPLVVEAEAPEAWMINGLWHVTSVSYLRPAHSGDHCYWFGYGRNVPEVTPDPQSVGDYDLRSNTGYTDAEILLRPIISMSERSYGALDSPNFLVPATEPYLSFWSWRETEEVLGRDVCKVFISTDVGATWELLRDLDEEPDSVQKEWTKSIVDLAGYEGQAARIRFLFDTIDEQLNEFTGWVLDDVLVTAGLRDEGDDDPGPQGEVTLGDVIMMLKYVVGLGPLTKGDTQDWDFDGDGSVTLADVIMALEIVVGLPPA